MKEKDNRNELHFLQQGMKSPTHLLLGTDHRHKQDQGAAKALLNSSSILLENNYKSNLAGFFIYHV